MYGSGDGITGFDQQWRALREKLAVRPSLDNLQILADAYNLHRDAAYAGCLGVKLSKRDKDGTRRRQLFGAVAGAELQIQLGRKFDREIAILYEIAFDLEEGSAGPEQVRAARRKRRHR
jgi:hypothetical protein